MPGIAYSFEKDAGHGGPYVERINNHQRYIAMKSTKVFIIAFWTFLTLIPAKGLEKEKDEQAGKIFEYIGNNDIFALIDIYPSIKDSVDVAVRNFTEAFMYKCMGNLQASVHYIEETLKEQDKTDDNIKINALLMLVNNLMQMQEYNEAANVMKYIIELTGIGELETAYHEILKYRDLPKRRYIRPEENFEISFKFKKIGRGDIMFIPCEINGKEKEAVFDTGCNISNVSLSFAVENNIFMTDQIVSMQGIGGASGGRLGVIDSIKAGNMVYRDVVCTIRESPTPLDSVADIFLGLDLISDAGEFHILPKEEKIYFPVHDTPFPETGINMAIIDGVPFVKAYTEKERVILLFDSGNVGMDMNGSYYRKHREKIQKDGIKEKIPVGGIGGLSGQEVYILSEFPLQIGKAVIDVSNVNVFTDNVMHQMDDIVVDGNLGVRFIRACNKITVNFRKSFIGVE